MKKFFKFVASFFIIIFVIEICLIKDSSAQLLHVTSDSRFVYYLNTERCAWMGDDYGNCAGIALVRCMEKKKPTYSELILEFRRNANYSRKDAFADGRIAGIWIYDLKSGKLLDSSTELGFPFEPAIYGSLADLVLGAVLDNCAK